MICDFCEKQTEKNWFTDNYTVLCFDCAKSAGIYGGQRAVNYINKKANEKNFSNLSSK